MKRWPVALVAVIVLSIIIMPVAASARGNTQPAAPAVASELLKEAGVKAIGPYISAVAREMGPGTDFRGVPKSDVLAYRQEVADFLRYLLPGTFSASSDTPVGASRKIVVFRASVDDESVQDRVIAQAGATKVRRLGLVNAAVVWSTPASERALAKRQEVLRVEPDLEVTALAKPPSPPGQDKKPPAPAPDPGPSQFLPWGVERIGSEDAWPYSTGSGVKVAVLDTGIQLDHPDLIVWGGVNFTGPSSKYGDDNGHGTHVAGIIAAVNNNIGVVGVAHEARLYSVKVLDRRGSGYLSDVISGLEWSINNGMQVVNMSLGSRSSTESFQRAVRLAYEAGIVLVAAAGNDGPDSNSVNYPARYEEVIAVSATDASDVIASFSSRGPQVELCAPGVGIPSTYTGGTYRELSGTSMAAPHVSAVAALVLSEEELSPEDVRAVLRLTAHDLGTSGKDAYYGYGLVDAYSAVWDVVVDLAAD